MSIAKTLMPGSQVPLHVARRSTSPATFAAYVHVLLHGGDLDALQGDAFEAALRKDAGMRLAMRAGEALDAVDVVAAVGLVQKHKANIGNLPTRSGDARPQADLAAYISVMVSVARLQVGLKKSKPLYLAPNDRKGEALRLRAGKMADRIMAKCIRRYPDDEIDAAYEAERMSSHAYLDLYATAMFYIGLASCDILGLPNTDQLPIKDAARLVSVGRAKEFVDLEVKRLSGPIRRREMSLQMVNAITSRRDQLFREHASRMKASFATGMSARIIQAVAGWEIIRP